MSEYSDFWKSLGLPEDQSPKVANFSTVANNLDKANLTDAEQYSMGWGPEAVPEQWVKQRAADINKQIQGAKSTDILRGAAQAAVPVKDAAPDAAKAANGGAQQSTESEYGHGGVSSGSSDSGSTDGAASSGWGMNKTGYGFSGLSANGAKAGAITGNPLGVVAGAVLGGVYADPMGKFAYDKLVAQEKRDAQDAKDGVGGNFSRSDINSFNKDADPIGALADHIGMGKSQDYGGSSHDQSGDGGRDHGNSGSAPGGGA